MKYYLFLMLVLLPLVFAQDKYDPGDNVIITATCYNVDNLACSSSATCNLSKLTDPKGELIYTEEQVMNNTFTNLYEFNLTAPSTIGNYLYETTCVDGLLGGVTADSFEVVYNNLDYDSYATYLNNVEIGTKILFFIFIIGFSCWWIARLKKREETPYYLVALWRSLIGGVSYIMLFTSPIIALFLFHPNFNIGILQRVTLNTYIVIFAVAGPIFLFNLFYFGSTMLLNLGGFKVDSERNSKVLDHLSKFFGDMKLYKNKITNKFLRG